MYKHVVCFKFRDKAEAPIVAQKLAALKYSVPQIRTIELGVNSNEVKGAYDLALIATFDSFEDYKIYDTAQPHMLVREYIHTVKETSISVDYACEG